MIFKIHRTKGNTSNLFDGSGGFAYLKGDVYPVIAGIGDTLLITPWYSEIGSGLTIFGTSGGPVSKLFAFNVARHEYGHYLLGSHRVCGIMGQGDGFLNPWESYRLGYMSKINVNFSTPSYSLYDYASRNRSGQILQVPIQDSTEFFIITNRSKVSNYDVMMYGDTAQGDPFKDVANYGKGLYIYHSVGILGLGGWDYSSTIDQECADGLYNYTQTGFDAPEWDPSNYRLPVLVPSSVSYKNDSAYVCDPNCTVKLNNTDDRNAKGLASSNAIEFKWFSKGEKPNLDKIYTNENENWTSRSHLGDRYDAWNVGYNEVFSPYSSPNTNTLLISSENFPTFHIKLPTPVSLN